MKFFLALSMLLASAAAQPSHGKEISVAASAMCQPLRDAFLHNIDAIIRLESVNFMLKKDEVYVDRYSGYYDDALANFDAKTLMAAIDVISANCPLPSTKGS